VIGDSTEVAVRKDHWMRKYYVSVWQRL